MKNRLLFAVIDLKHEGLPAWSFKFQHMLLQRMIEFKKYIFLLHLQLFNKLIFTPRVSQIVYLNWCSAAGAATIVRNNGTSTHPHLTPDHLSAQVLFKTYMSYSWEHHPSLVGTANPSRLQPGSRGARGRPNLCLHYTQAIHYSLPVALCPLFGGHYGHTSSHSQPKWRLHSYMNSTPGKYNHSPSLLYVSPILTRHFCTAPFRCGKMKLSVMLPVPLFNDDLLCLCDVEALKQ